MGDIFLVIGLGFGDEGKGTIIESLTRQHKAKLTVRYNGGAQAAHHVVRDDGTVHAFRQFGSGTFEGARTHLSRFHLFDPIALGAEVQALASKGITDPMSLLTIDEKAPLTTPYHVIANQMQECALGDGRHGSCGMGIWETQHLASLYGDMVPHAKDLLSQFNLVERLAMVRQMYIDGCEEIRDTNAETRKKWDLLTSSDLGVDNVVKRMLLAGIPAIVDREYLWAQLRNSDPVIFEGAQGVLLDPERGFFPHVTGTNTTRANADKLLHEASESGHGSGDISCIGVMRTYMTRHGAGPLPTEYPPHWAVREEHNGVGQYQGAFRSGALDLVLLRYALRCSGGVDMLAVTHVDRPIDLCCYAYKGMGNKIEPLENPDVFRQEELTRSLFGVAPIVEEAPRGLDFIAEHLQTPIGIVSRGPRCGDKEFMKKDGQSK